MTFKKNADVQTLAVATYGDDGIKKTAAYEKEDVSEFLNKRKPIDIKAALEIVASEYDISDNPSNYIFEAIRGNTSNVPNENKDAFHKNELLRFDHRLSKHVYRTYELKPHHVNHRAENPKNARGFILDAHYNDSTPPLDECPNCGNRTASVEERDETGIHCRKCGNVVKDEFVELLVAIDTQKDPTFAKGVQAGILKHGSMGCSCMRTRCNVCNNVAYSRNEFCAHIKNKGKTYDDSEPKFNPVAFVIKYDGKDKTAKKASKTAKAFEWCEGVIYDEYSRVHDPADVKAEQYEILKLGEKIAQMTTDGQLQNESEILILQSKLADLERRVEDKFNRVAQVLPDLPPPPPGLPPTGSSAPSPGMGDMPPSLPEMEEEKGQGDVTININTTPEGVEVSSDELEETSLDKTPIEDLTPESVGATPAGPGGVLSPAAMGIAEEPKSATPPKLGNKENSGGPSMLRFADSYKHLKAEITSAGNIRVYDDIGTLFVVKPDKKSGKVASIDLENHAKQVLTTVAQYGIGSAINITKAIVGPRLAQVLEYYHDDMTGVDRGEESSVLDKAEMDSKEKRPKSKDTVTGDGAESDRQEGYDENVSLKNDALSDRDTDLEDEQHDRNPADLAVVDMDDSDMRDKHDEWNMGDDALQDGANDMKSAAKEKKGKGKCCPKCKEEKCVCDAGKKAYDIKQHAARIEALYKSRLEAKVAELEKEKTKFISNMSDRFARALKLVARRQALNLEYSPMKTAMGITLCNPMPLGNGEEYMPMDQKTAVTLVEAAFNEPMIEGIDKAAWEASIDGMIGRAAEIMKWNDETLMQVEADINNIKVAAVPLDESAVKPNVDFNLKQAAKRGNLQLSPVESVDSKLDAGDRRQAIRNAVGTTKVAGLASFGK